MRILSILFTATFVLSCSHKEAPFVLASGDVDCAIVVNLGSYSDALQAAADYQSVDWFDADRADDDNCRNAFAALELQQHLAQLIGVSVQHLPIVDDDAAPRTGSLIFIGTPKSDGKFVAKLMRRRWRKNRNADEQSFRFDSFSTKNRKGLVISGASTGVLYGVYELLERWGTRWYTPDDGTETAPIPRIEVDNLHEMVQPSFAFRGFWIDAQRPSNQADPSFVHWMGRNRINIFRNQEADIAALKLRGIRLNTGSRDVLTNLLSPNRPYRYNHPAFKHDEHLPTDPYLLSERYQGDQNHDGQLTYGEAHPDWFAVQTDSAAIKHGGAAVGFCPSQPEAVREFCRLIVDELTGGEWRNCDIIDLWAPEAWCDCPNCRKIGNAADKLLYMVHNVAKHLEDARKNSALTRDIYLFGYGQSEEHEPPTIALPRDFNNGRTAIFISAWPRCYAHHIISTECINVNLWFMKELLGWLNGRGVYKGLTGIMENYNADAFHGLPTLFSGVMSIDIPAYAALGVTGMNFMHTRTRDLGINALLNYQYARQTWHCDIDIDDLRAEFFKFIYPGAVKEMRDYYASMEECLSTISTFAYFMPQRAPLLMEAMRQDSTNRRLMVNEQFDWQRLKEEPNFNDQWESSYQRIHQARHQLGAARIKDLTPQVLARLADLEKERQYAELMINTYDNMIIFFTAGPEDSDSRTEALLRLQENRQLLSKFAIPSPMLGPADALNASGMRQVIDDLLSEHTRILGHSY